MSSPYVGEIRMFGGNFAPAGWAFCDGALQDIAQNDTLFNLIGTTYGGDGQATFALPDLRSRFPMHTSASHVLGEMSGTETVTLIPAQIPQHNHIPLANTGSGDLTSAQGAIWAQPGTANKIYSTAAPLAAMGASMVGLAGGNQPHENMPPFVVISFIISLFGIFPSPN